MAKAVPNKQGRPRKLFDRDITKDRKVSKFHLDDNAEEQADAFGYWSDLAPKAKRQADDMVLDIEIKTGEQFVFFKASLDGGLDSKGNEKAPTDTSVLNAIACDEEIIAMKRKLLELKEYYGLIQSATTTMEHRRSSINVLRDLFSDDYFTMKGLNSDQFDSREQKKTRIKDAKNKIGEGLKNMNVPEDETEILDEDDGETEVETVAPIVTKFAGSDPREKNETPDEESGENSDTPEVISDFKDPEEIEDIPLDAPEETETGEEKVTSEPEEEPANLCPFKHVFGEFGQHDDCDNCDSESACFRESRKQ
jgi:hypothetical protein